MNKKKLNKANKQALKGITQMLPIMFAMLLLVSIFTNLVPKSFYNSLFTGNIWTDSLIGDVLGSILMGNPITGYVIGNELLQNGVGLVAVTAFLVAWVTVGVVQLPVEIIIMGKGFAIARNVTAFFMAIVVAIITVMIVQII